VENIPVGSLLAKSLSTIVILLKKDYENQHFCRKIFFRISGKFVPNFYHFVQILGTLPDYLIHDTEK
jgi:hypothetical protein